MARPRKPTGLLLLNGGLEHNKKRYADRANEPKPTGPIGEPPEGMDADVARCWREIVAESAPGVLTVSDRGILAIAADLRRHSERGDPVNVAERGQEPVYEYVTDPKKIALLVRCYTELGMTPASRSKVQAKPQDEKPASAFAAV
jgi:phage terminase small subunit